jgi:hypothetical protein
MLRRDPSPGSAGRIDDELVTWEEADRSLNGIKGEIHPELRRSVLRQRVELKVALAAARRAGITAGEEESTRLEARLWRRGETTSAFRSRARRAGGGSARS